MALAVLAMLFSMASAPALASTVEACLAASDNWQDRIAVCTQAIESGDLDDADLSVGYRERGRAYSEIGETDTALRNLTNAIALNQSDIESWSLRGRQFFDLGRLDDAQRDFQRALRMNTNHLDPSALLGCTDVLKARGISDTRKSYREQCWMIVQASFESEPPYNAPKHREFNEDAVYLIESMLYSLGFGDMLTAAAAYARAAQLDPNATLCLWDRNRGFDGYILRQYDMLVRPEAYRDGVVPRTLAELQAALRENPENAAALRERGLLFAAIDDWFGAVDNLDAALESDPGSVPLMVLSTMARLKLLERPYLALEFPNTARGYYTPDEMLKRIERAMVLGADDFFTHLTYAKTLNWQPREDNLGRVEQEKAELDRAIELLPTWPEHPLKRFLAFNLYIDRGGAWHRLGDNERSTADFLLSADPPGVDKTLLDQRCLEP